MSNRHRGRESAYSWYRSTKPKPRAARGDEQDFNDTKGEEVKATGNGRQSPASASSHARSENNKISAQVRIMARLESLDIFKKACQQIQDLLFYSENKQYMIRFFNTFVFQFSEIFKALPVLHWRDAGIKVYGKFFSTVYTALDSQGYIVGNFLLEKLQKKYNSAAGTAIYETILEAILHLSPKHTALLTAHLLQALDVEEASSSELFKKFCSVFVSCLLHNMETSMTTFEEFIDIVVGWMIDDSEKVLGDVYIYCYDVIQHLEPYFRADIEFLSSFLTHLLAEIEATADVTPCNLPRLFRLIKAVSAFLALGSPLEKDFVKENVERLCARVTSVLTQQPASKLPLRPACNVMIYSNETIALCQGIEGPEMCKLLKNQLTLIRESGGPQDWPTDYLRKLILTITSWIETVSFQTQPGEDVKEVMVDVLPFIDAIQPLFPPQDQFLVMKLVHALLRTRCIVLLQTIYHWVVGKLNVENLEGSSVEHHHKYSKDADLVLMVLAYLSDIATNKSGSILSLWALNPSIIDLLLSLIHEMDEDEDYRVRCCSFELLKSHCVAHSHFVSSIATAHKFSSESPALRFLASLMNFWIEKIQKNEPQWNESIFDWVSVFLKTSASYATNLVETHSHFYREILRKFTSNLSLRKGLAELLTWMVEDTHYRPLEFIQATIRECCLRVLLENNITQNTHSEFAGILKQLPSIILLEPELNDSAALFSLEVNAEEKSDLNLCEEIKPMTHPEFNRFLLQLFTHDKDRGSHSPPSRESIKSAVDFLIRLKLKTTVGRAQDFFTQLQYVFRKGRRGNSLPVWKLDFAYQLEKKIILCIHQSSFLTCTLPEVIRMFYVTNKKPCLEWLKRMVPDLIDISLNLGCYTMAYYYSTSLSDDPKAKVALLELEDAEGLRGMGEYGGYSYLTGEYEKAEALLKKSTDDPGSVSPLKATILKRTDAILNRAAASLEQWPEASKQAGDAPSVTVPPVSLLELPGGSVKTFVNVQLDILRKLPKLEIRGSVESFRRLSLFELLQLEEIAQNSNSLNRLDKQRIETLKIDRMIEHGNLDFARNYLTRNSWDDTRNKIESQQELKASTFKILGDMLYKEGDFEKSARLLVSAYELIQQDANMYGTSSPHFPNQFKTHIYLNFAHKIRRSDILWQHIAITSPHVVEGFDGRHQILQSLYEKARDSARNSELPVKVEAWYQYATFTYDRSDEEDVPPLFREVLKSNALHSYASYIKWNQKLIGSVESKPKIMTAMIRLLKLYHQGHKFIPEDLITSDHWLLLLPELAKVEELRPILLSRFPHEASILIATLEHGRKFKGFAKRRGVFDPATYAFTEASEEPFQTVSPLNTAFGVHNSVADFLPPNQETNYADPSCLFVIQQIEAVGTTREEIWAAAIHRVSADWIKRVNILKKDLARDKGKNLGKVQAYVAPLLNYFTQLWNKTKDGNTPAEFSFICRNGEKINEIISALGNCNDAETLGSLYEQTINFAGMLESSITSKLMLVNLSPKLAKFDFVHCSPSISLPGFNRNVTVVGVQPIMMCLPTKSKPKKIAFRGSDGKVYEYLIKGNENLNIDAGIMQLLKIAQEFSGYPTRSYSVTPIGERGGLIQIVKDAGPLFVLYKKYLRRNNLTERPSEMYWRLLNSFGYSDRSNVEILKKVYLELVKETPAELIQRDLLLSADDTQSWYKSVGTFTRDCAMGSALGYVVGLGDRHLDNILLNPRKGHLVHVDFSILFGKGRSLKIPELVPFRLSQNMIAALQYPGVTGAFRVYLDKLLLKFKNYEEAVMFCVQDIAAASQLDERLPIDPEILLVSEIRATFELLKLRIGNVWKIMELLISEISQSIIIESRPQSVWNAHTGMGSDDRLKKKLYRWRRLLANLDPLLQFLISHTKATGTTGTFHNIVVNSWNNYVMTFWCHPTIDQLLGMKFKYGENFGMTQGTIQSLLSNIPLSDMSIEINHSVLSYSVNQTVDILKTDSTIHTVRKRILSYDQSTAKALIEQATNADNLSQMYEGWTSWV